MRKYEVVKFSRLPFFYSLVIGFAFACSIIFKIRNFDSSIIPLGIFVLSAPLLINLNRSTYSVFLDNEAIYINNLKSTKESTIISYSDILRIGSKNKFKRALYIYTMESEYYFPSCVEGIVKLCTEIKELSQRAICVEDDAIQVFLKNYFMTTRYIRLNWFLQLMFLSLFSYLFFNIGVETWLFLASINMVSLLIYGVVDQTMASQKMINKDLFLLQKWIVLFNKLPSVLSTIIFISQIVAISLSLL